MIYLDHGATSFPKPPGVIRAVARAMETCANPGRGGHIAAMEAAKTVFSCRERAAQMFDCQPEQVVFTGSCTHGLNLAIRTLVRPGDRVVISGFEHNAVTRPLHLLGARVRVAGRKLFDPEDTLNAWEDALKAGASVAIFTHMSNVFGYILPAKEMARLCKKYGVPFVVDAAQSAGALPVSMEKWGADFIAMPGHKGLLGPQGTGLLLCGRKPEILIAGGTGSNSLEQKMPEDLPDRAEAGTLNVPGIAGLAAGLAYVNQLGTQRIFEREKNAAKTCAEGLKKLGFTVFSGENQGGTISFVPDMDCEEAAAKMEKMGFALRAGLHCAPLAHESAGTQQTGTVRISFGHKATEEQAMSFCRCARILQQ